MKKRLLQLFPCIIFTTSSFAQFSCGDLLIDSRDGQSYPTVQIGSHCWMAKNLNIGVQITSVNTGASHTELNDNQIIEKFCYENNNTNCSNEGGLYTWDEMMQYDTIEGIQGICPLGWRLPNHLDWDTLLNQFSSSTVSTDLQVGGSSGFEARLSGRRQGVGSFIYLGEWGFMSSSSRVDTQIVYNVFFNYTQTFFMFENNKQKYYAFSVRCLRDITSTNYEKSEEQSLDELIAYPNPAQDFINIQYSFNFDEGPGCIIIYDVFGRVIEEFCLNNISGVMKISTYNLHSGIFYFRLFTEKKIGPTKKIIIVK